jgi:hypothetical protein
MATEPSGAGPHRARNTSSDERKRRMQQAGGVPAGGAPTAGGRVRADERRRYLFLMWTNIAFTLAWFVVFVLSGSWIFLIFLTGCALLACVAGGCLIVLRRRALTRSEDAGPTLPGR